MRSTTSGRSRMKIKIQGYYSFCNEERAGRAMAISETSRKIEAAVGHENFRQVALKSWL